MSRVSAMDGASQARTLREGPARLQGGDGVSSNTPSPSQPSPAVPGVLPRTKLTTQESHALIQNDRPSSRDTDPASRHRTQRDCPCRHQKNGRSPRTSGRSCKTSGFLRRDRPAIRATSGRLRACIQMYAARVQTYGKRKHDHAPCLDACAKRLRCCGESLQMYAARGRMYGRREHSHAESQQTFLESVKTHAYVCTIARQHCPCTRQEIVCTKNVWPIAWRYSRYTGRYNRIFWPVNLLFRQARTLAAQVSLRIESPCGQMRRVGSPPGPSSRLAWLSSCPAARSRRQRP